MSVSLDPKIQEKLHAFAKRRKKLILMKGGLATLAMLLLTMLAVAALDLVWLLPDWLRWTLSAAAYLTVIVVAWRVCLRLLLHAPDEKRLARLIEHAEPGLREDLISAVELGRPGGAVFDSEQFRALLQSDVARRMDGVEVSSLLPVALIRKSIGYAVVMGVAALAIMVASGWRFHTLLLRALLPGANLERVSRTKVIIEEPSGGDRIVPQGDTVRVVVELAGQPASRAKIETQSEQGGWQVMDMQALSGNKFAATIQVGRASVRYRIKAGDALTRKYLLDARERPYVVEFAKTFHFPAYSEIPEKSVTEREGGIVALEGTEVELKVRPSQPVKNGELLIEQGKTSSTIALSATPDGWLAGKLTMTASGSYRVHLVAAQTGFENKFSPENELRVEADLAPVIEMETPRADLILPANEIVDVTGSASDDFGIARVSRALRVNDGPWKETALAEKPGKKVRIEHQWDLFDSGAKAGDLLTLKLVVRDLKGHKAESRALQVTVTAAGFEMRRLTWLESLRAANEAAYTMAAKSEDLVKNSRQFAQDVQAPDRQQAVAAFSAALSEFETKSTEAWTALGTALRGARDGHASAELVTVGRALARVNIDGIKLARSVLDSVTPDLSPRAAQVLGSWAADGVARISKRATDASRALETMTTAEESAILWENSEILVREQRRLMEMAAAAGDDAARWAPVLARVRVTMSQAKVIEELVEAVSNRDSRRGSDWAKTGAKQLRKHRDDLSGAITATGKPDRKMLQRLGEFHRGVESAVSSFASRSREAAARPTSAVDGLLRDVEPVYANLDRLVRDGESVMKEGSFSPATKASLAAGRWAVRGEFFKVAGDIEEIRPHADNHFVADLRNATGALAALQALAPGGDVTPVRERIEELDSALRVLESGHDIMEVLDGFNTLAVAERWDLRSLAARSDAPRDWRWLESRLRSLPGELQRSRPPKGAEELRAVFTAAGEILHKAQGLEAWRGVEREMSQRGNAGHQPVTARKDAELLAGQVKLALDLFRKPMEEARQRLAKVAPSVSDLAKALAKEQEKTKQETEKQAAQAAERKPEDALAAAQKQLAQQQDINRKVETLKDLIRAEANKQDILNEQQREVMRDADDALAMLKDPPPKSEQALKEASETEAEEHKMALDRATAQQAKLAEALEQIARHFEAKEQGKPLAETRAALREAEQELGIKEQLDQQQAHAQMLAELARKSPQELLKELEAKLPQNPAMQKELSDISKDVLADAEQKLATASKQEDAVAKQLAQQAQQEDGAMNQAKRDAAEAARDAAKAAEAAKQAAQEAQQQAKTAGNQQAEQQAAKAANEAAMASAQAEQAAKAATEMAAAQDAAKTVEAAKKTAQNAAEAAKSAQQAMDSAKQASAAAAQEAQKGGEKQPANNNANQQAAKSAQQAEKAAAAAKQAEALAQQAAAQAQAMAANAQAQPSPQQAPQPGQPQQPGQQMQQQNPQLANAARQQQPVAQNAGEAAEATDRAGRHEMRLGNQPAGEQLQKLADAIQQTAGEQVPAAQQALEEAKMAAQAQAPVDAANQQLAQQVKALQAAARGAAQQAQSQQAMQQPAQSPQMAAENQQAQPAQAGQPAQPQAGQQAQANAEGAQQATPAEQQAMARALDALDQELNAASMANNGAQQQGQQGQQSAQQGQQGQQGQQQGQQGQQQQGQQGQQAGQQSQDGQPSDSQSSSQNAMAQAAQAAAASMRQSRSESAATQQGSLMSGAQSDKSIAGAKADGTPMDSIDLPDLRAMKSGEWGRLPKKVAEQLTKGAQETVPGDYRQAVEAYYRVLADKAKKRP